MKERLRNKLGLILGVVAAGAIAFGWLGVAGAMPGVMTQPFETIADVLNPDDSTVTTLPGDTTDSSVPGDTTVTTSPEDTTVTTAPDQDDDADDEDGADDDDASDDRSSRNCSRFAAGDDCARPVTPGYERHSDDDDDDETVTSTTEPSASQERTRTRNRGRGSDDD